MTLTGKKKKTLDVLETNPNLTDILCNYCGRHLDIFSCFSSESHSDIYNMFILLLVCVDSSLTIFSGYHLSPHWIRSSVREGHVPNFLSSILDKIVHMSGLVKWSISNPWIFLPVNEQLIISPFVNTKVRFSSCLSVF